MRTLASGLLAALSLAACSTLPYGKTVTLTPAGTAVHVVNGAPDRCTEVGDVFGSFEAQDPEQALLGAKIALRNHAGRLGADHVILQTSNSSMRRNFHTFSLGGSAVRCGAPITAPAPVAAPGVSL